LFLNIKRLRLKNLKFDWEKTGSMLIFSKHQSKLNISLDLSNSKTVITNYPRQSKNGSLAPYESIVYQLK
jgi:hypothetical protein